MKCAVAFTAFMILVTGQTLSTASSPEISETPIPIESLEIAPPNTLVGMDARTQLIVTGLSANGHSIDLTRDVVFAANPEHVVNIDASGLVTPIADGTTTVTATDSSGVTTQVLLTVTGTGVTQSVSFPSQVVPIFTKFGCNGGGCHGKIAGQNGFRLSLLGFEPKVDHKHLVAHSLGRRLSVAAPDQSLLLQKSINAVPHGGGARMDRESHEYRLLRRWIAQGMPYGDGSEPTVTGIEVFPQTRRIAPGTMQQLSVIATYSDGPGKTSRGPPSLSPTTPKWQRSLPPDSSPSGTSSETLR